MQQSNAILLAKFNRIFSSLTPKQNNFPSNALKSNILATLPSSLHVAATTKKSACPLKKENYFSLW